MDDNSVDIVVRGSRTTPDPANYAYSGKVMLASVLILAVVCIVIAFFHMYSRWYLLRAAATHRNRSSSSTRTTTTTTTASVLPQSGLDQSTIKSIHTFAYSTTTQTAPLECAICLSEFEEKETARLLPKCNHCFHLDCIDMWFHSHTNCPLCRTPISAQFHLPESPIGNSSVVNIDDLGVIIDALVTGVSTEENPASGIEAGNGYKPVRIQRLFLSV